MSFTVREHVHAKNVNELISKNDMICISLVYGLDEFVNIFLVVVYM